MTPIKEIIQRIAKPRFKKWQQISGKRKGTGKAK